jgi:hypothetical protein
MLTIKKEYDPENHPFLAGAEVPERRVLTITSEESQRAGERHCGIMMSNNKYVECIYC